MTKAKKRKVPKLRKAEGRYQIIGPISHKVALADPGETAISRWVSAGQMPKTLPDSARLVDESAFVFVYGLQTKTNAVNVFTVAPALQAFASLVTEAHRTLHPDGPPLDIKVRPFRKGSLLTDLVMSAPTWGPLMAAYGHAAAPYIRQLLEQLGVVKSTINGVLKVVEFLKKPPRAVEQMNENTFRYFSDDMKHHIDVQAPVHTLIQNQTIHYHIHGAVVVPIETGHVSGVVLKAKGAKKGGAVTVGKKHIAAIKEFKKARELPKAVAPLENETTVYLHPKRGSFDAEGKQWSFHRGKEIITANVKDEEFLEAYRAGRFRIHHTDILKVRLVEHQKIKNGKVHTTHDIVEVLDYQAGDHQPQLRAQNE